MLWVHQITSKRCILKDFQLSFTTWYIRNEGGVVVHSNMYRDNNTKNRRSRILRSLAFGKGCPQIVRSTQHLATYILNRRWELQRSSRGGQVQVRLWYIRLQKWSILSDIQSWMTIKKTEISAQPEFLKPIYLLGHRVIVLIYLDVHQNLSPSFLMWEFLNGHP